MRKNVSELSAFVNRSGSFRGAVTANTSGEGELFEKLPQAFDILALFRIDLRIGSLKIGGTEDTRSPMAGSGQKDHVEIIFLDQPVQVDVNERQSWARSPVPEKAILDLLRMQRLGEQGIVLQVDHAQAQVIASSPEDLGLLQVVGGEWRSLDGGTRGSIRTEFDVSG